MAGASRSVNFQKRYTEIHRWYADADALRNEISRLEAQAVSPASTAAHIDCISEGNYKTRLEVSMDSHVQTLCNQLREAEAAGELVSLVALKEDMILALGAISGNHCQDAGLIKESKIQLSNYQRCLGLACFHNGNLAEAAEWLRRSMKIQKSELGKDDVESQKTLNELCMGLTESNNEDANYEGERLLFVTSHSPNPDTFAITCARQLGDSYMRRENYRDAGATFLGV